MTLSLLPESVIEERPSWTLAVNRNQHLLGKTMLVLRRYCTAVIDIAPDEWALLRGELRRVVPALDGLFRPDQFNFAFLMNLDAQVHLHVVPRYRSSRRWHDRTFTDAVGRAVRPGATANCPRQSSGCLPPRSERSWRDAHAPERRIEARS